MNRTMATSLYDLISSEPSTVMRRKANVAERGLSLRSGGAIFGTFVPGAVREAVWNHFCYASPFGPCAPQSGLIGHTPQRQRPTGDVGRCFCRG
jgi:hypothetical protein